MSTLGIFRNIRECWVLRNGIYPKPLAGTKYGSCVEVQLEAKKRYPVAFFSMQPELLPLGSEQSKVGPK